MYAIDTEVICSSKVEDETLILNLDTGFYYTLDALGGLIWERLLEKQNEEQIVAAISREYDADPVKIKKDLRDIIGEFQKEGLIQIK